MGVPEVILPPALNSRDGPLAPVMDTLAPAGTDLQKIERGEESASSSGREKRCDRGDPDRAAGRRGVQAELARRDFYTDWTSSQSGRTSPG